MGRRHISGKRAPLSVQSPHHTTPPLFSPISFGSTKVMGVPNASDKKQEYNSRNLALLMPSTMMNDKKYPSPVPGGEDVALSLNDSEPPKSFGTAKNNKEPVDCHQAAIQNTVLGKWSYTSEFSGSTDLNWPLTPKVIKHAARLQHSNRNDSNLNEKQKSGTLHAKLLDMQTYTSNGSCNMTDEQLARFRTQICPRKSTYDTCWLEERCPFSHCLSWHRRNPMITGYRPTLCPNVVFCIGPNRKMRVKNHCHRGRLCLFSHTKEEQMYHPLVYKSQLCRDWPECTKHFCPFAHGPEELRHGQQTKLALAQGPEKPEATMEWHRALLESNGWSTKTFTKPVTTKKSKAAFSSASRDSFSNITNEVLSTPLESADGETMVSSEEYVADGSHSPTAKGVPHERNSLLRRPFHSHSAPIMNTFRLDQAASSFLSEDLQSGIFNAPSHVLYSKSSHLTVDQEQQHPKLPIRDRQPERTLSTVSGSSGVLELSSSSQEILQPTVTNTSVESTSTFLKSSQPFDIQTNRRQRSRLSTLSFQHPGSPECSLESRGCGNSTGLCVFNPQSCLDVHQVIDRNVSQTEVASTPPISSQKRVGSNDNKDSTQHPSLSQCVGSSHPLSAKLEFSPDSFAAIAPWNIPQREPARKAHKACIANLATASQAVKNESVEESKLPESKLKEKDAEAINKSFVLSNFLGSDYLPSLFPSKHSVLLDENERQCESMMEVFLQLLLQNPLFKTSSLQTETQDCLKFCTATEDQDMILRHPDSLEVGNNQPPLGVKPSHYMEKSKTVAYPETAKQESSSGSSTRSSLSTARFPETSLETLGKLKKQDMSRDTLESASMLNALYPTGGHSPPSIALETNTTSAAFHDFFDIPLSSACKCASKSFESSSTRDSGSVQAYPLQDGNSDSYHDHAPDYLHLCCLPSSVSCWNLDKGYFGGTPTPSTSIPLESYNSAYGVHVRHPREAGAKYDRPFAPIFPVETKLSTPLGPFHHPSVVRSGGFPKSFPLETLTATAAAGAQK